MKGCIRTGGVRDATFQAVPGHLAHISKLVRYCLEGALHRIILPFQVFENDLQIRESSLREYCDQVMWAFISWDGPLVAFLYGLLCQTFQRF